MITHRFFAWLGCEVAAASPEELRPVSPAPNLNKFARLLYSGEVADLKQIVHEFRFPISRPYGGKCRKRLTGIFTERSRTTRRGRLLSI